ncbi:hypothetical protein RUM44_007664 [Polyplax serrata]|uniref:Uncharacterized protein n=1 Tax=Polyplax serrata TaxID=468196 RepID=A0ABR1B718_POLSC
MRRLQMWHERKQTSEQKLTIQKRSRGTIVKQLQETKETLEKKMATGCVRAVRRQECEFGQKHMKKYLLPERRQERERERDRNESKKIEKSKTEASALEAHFSLGKSKFKFRLPSKQILIEGELKKVEEEKILKDIGRLKEKSVIGMRMNVSKTIIMVNLFEVTWMMKIEQITGTDERRDTPVAEGENGT